MHMLRIHRFHNATSVHAPTHSQGLAGSAYALVGTNAALSILLFIYIVVGRLHKHTWPG